MSHLRACRLALLLAAALASSCAAAPEATNSIIVRMDADAAAAQDSAFSVASDGAAADPVADLGQPIGQIGFPGPHPPYDPLPRHLPPRVGSCRTPTPPSSQPPVPPPSLLQASSMPCQTCLSTPAA